MHIRNDLRDQGIRPSDRRFRQSLSLLKAQAALQGRNVVKNTDIAILKNGLWETTDQKNKTVEIVENYSVDICQSHMERIERMAKELYEAVKGDPSAEVGMEAMTKFKQLITDIADLLKKFPERANEIEKVKSKVIKAQEQISSVLLGI
jgi:MoxR-like ATPase